MSQERSAEWLRGAVAFYEENSSGLSMWVRYNEYRTLLAEAEAREASVPTAADLAVADELDLLAAHIQQYIGPDDARDDIRRICRNRAADLRRGVKRGPTAAEELGRARQAAIDLANTLAQQKIAAAEVIAAAERAILQVGQWDTFTQREKGLMKSALAAIAKWKEATNA